MAPPSCQHLILRASCLGKQPCRLRKEFVILIGVFSAATPPITCGKLLDLVLPCMRSRQTVSVQAGSRGIQGGEGREGFHSTTDQPGRVLQSRTGAHHCIQSLSLGVANRMMNYILKNQSLRFRAAHCRLSTGTCQSRFCASL